LDERDDDLMKVVGIMLLQPLLASAARAVAANDTGTGKSKPGVFCAVPVTLF